MKVVVTGGSGFIGTNLIEELKKNTAITILNIDISKPKLQSHNIFWKNCDILDELKLREILNEFQPNFIYHLAARTDLDSDNTDNYKANTDGVKNIANISSNLTTLKGIVFMSSMLVCSAGDQISSLKQYNPPNAYGKSKMLGEQIVLDFNWKDLNKNSVILRPTSIWGPFFGAPYLDFYKRVMNNSYFHIGNRSASKSFGYVENIVYELIYYLDRNDKFYDLKILYLSDICPTHIEDWANKISVLSKSKRILKIPYMMIWIVAKFGDILKFFNINFPMYSYRLMNMTTNNVIDKKFISNFSERRLIELDKGIINTLNWIKSHESKKSL